MNFTKNHHLALLAAALLAAPAISVADNLIEIQDPTTFIHKETVEISTYEGDPAAGTKTGPQQCFALKAIGDDESNRWVAMKKQLEIDSAVRYRFRCSLFAEGEDSITVNISIYGGEGLLCDPNSSPFGYTLKPQEGKALVKGPTDGWVAMEAIVGPGEEMVWPEGAVKINIAINIRTESGTVVYVKDLSVEEMR